MAKGSSSASMEGKEVHVVETMSGGLENGNAVEMKSMNHYSGTDIDMQEMRTLGRTQQLNVRTRLLSVKIY